MECPQKFEVRQPRWHLLYGIVTLLISAAAIFATIIKLYLGELEVDLSVGIFSIVSVFVFIAAICLYSYFNDTFKYDNGEFMCKRDLHKTKTWNVNDLYCVNVFKVRGEISIQFWNKDRKKIMTANDSKGVWNDGRLRSVLYFYNIPIESNID